MATSIQIQLFQTLNQLLREGDEADRCYAARTAGEIGATESLMPLLDCLYHDDPDVCIDAADALARLGSQMDEPSMLVSCLIELVEMHPDGDARVAAARALAALENEEANRALLSWAMGNPAQDSADYVMDWDDWWDIQLNAIQALGSKRRSDAVPVLKAVLAEQPMDIESDLLKALVLCGEEGIDHALALMAEGDARLARRSATALRYARCNGSQVALFKALRHPDASVRGSAAEALGQRDARQYFIDLVELLRDPDAEVRGRALLAAEGMLAQLEPYHLKHISPEKLTRLLDALEPQGRALVLNALARLVEADYQPTDALCSAMLAGLASEHGAEVEAAAGLLTRMPLQEAEPVLLARLLDPQLPLSSRRCLVKTVQAVGRNHSEHLKTLNTLLQEEDNAALRQVAMEALNALAQLPAEREGLDARQVMERYLAGEEVATDTLMVAEPGDQAGRIPCAMVNEQGEPERSPLESPEEKMATMLAKFSDGYPEQDESVQSSGVSRSTLDAINRSNVEAAIQRSTVAEQDESRGEHVRDMVMDLPRDLDEFGDIVVSHLDHGEKLKLNRKKIAPLPTFNNRILAVRALGKVTTERSVEKLLNLLLENDPALLLEVVRSLAQIAVKQPDLKVLNKVVGPLSTLLLSGTDEIRQLSARVLGAVGHHTALPILKDALQDEDSNVRIEAIRALEQLLSRPVDKDDEERVVLHTTAPGSVLTAVKSCLADPADGVVLAALDFLAHEPAQDRVEQMVLLGLENSALTDKAARTVARLAPRQATKQLLQPILQTDFARQRPNALQMLTVLARSL